MGSLSPLVDVERIGSQFRSAVLRQRLPRFQRLARTGGRVPRERTDQRTAAEGRPRLQRSDRREQRIDLANLEFLPNFQREEVVDMFLATVRKYIWPGRDMTLRRGSAAPTSGAGQWDLIRMTRIGS